MKTDHNRYKHGKSYDRVYNVWKKMRDRCFNKNNYKYYLYGGKGITVCKDWLVFENFYNWAIENGYKSNLTIDRINGDKDYCPDNCRFVDEFIQNNNTNRNVTVQVNGHDNTLGELARKYSINYNTLYKRYATGKRGADLIAPVLL